MSETIHVGRLRSRVHPREDNSFSKLLERLGQSDPLEIRSQLENKLREISQILVLDSSHPKLFEPPELGDRPARLQLQFSAYAMALEKLDISEGNRSKHFHNIGWFAITAEYLVYAGYQPTGKDTSIDNMKKANRQLSNALEPFGEYNALQLAAGIVSGDVSPNFDNLPKAPDHLVDTA